MNFLHRTCYSTVVVGCWLLVHRFNFTLVLTFLIKCAKVICYEISGKNTKSKVSIKQTVLQLERERETHTVKPKTETGCSFSFGLVCVCVWVMFMFETEKKRKRRKMFTWLLFAIRYSLNAQPCVRIALESYFQWARDIHSTHTHRMNKTSVLSAKLENIGVHLAG